MPGGEGPAVGLGIGLVEGVVEIVAVAETKAVGKGNGVGACGASKSCGRRTFSSWTSASVRLASSQPNRLRVSQGIHLPVPSHLCASLTSGDPLVRASRNSFHGKFDSS